MTISAFPPAPSRADPSTFADKADAFLGHIESPFVAEINALEANVNTKEASAVSAAAAAEASKNAAGSVANAALWSVLTTYAAGQASIDPVNLLTYRALFLSAGGQRPALDSNWVLVNGTGNVRTDDIPQTLSGSITFEKQIQGSISGNAATATTTGAGGGNISTNLANGYQALYSNTTSGGNTANGYQSLYNCSGNGTGNSAFGDHSLYSLTSGQYNSAYGFYAGVDITTGAANCIFGDGAASGLTTISSSCIFGRNALPKYSTSGSDGYSLSVFGNGAGSNGSRIFFNSSMFGANSSVTGSNQVQLGDSATTTYVYGTVQNRSDLNDKADVRDTILGLEFVNALRPVDYRWDMREDYRPEMPEPLAQDATEAQKAQYEVDILAWTEACKRENIVRDGSKKRIRYHHGLIAQEVKETIDALGIDFGGYQDHKLQGGEDVLSIGYDELIAPLIKSVQQLSEMNKSLIERIEALENK